MEQTGAPKPLVRLELGSRYTLALSPRRLVAAAVMALLLVGCAWVIWQGDALEKNSYGWLVLVANAGMPLIGVGLGLILAPTPRPTDFSGIAAIAVDDVAELNRSTNALISSLNTLISSDELTTMPGTKLRLVSIQEELRRHLYVLCRPLVVVWHDRSLFLTIPDRRGQVHGGGVSVGDPSVVGSGGQGW